MPFKKKAPKAADEPAPPTETQQKPAEKVEPAPESKKEEVKPVPQTTTPPVQTPLSRLEQSIAAQQSQLNTENAQQKAQKIAIDDIAKLSEEERIQLRRLRFGTLGTETTAEEAERIKQERLKKFGGASLEDKETIEKRKQKFGIVATGEDPEIVKKRLEKFGSTGATSAQDKAILQQRRKKFGNPEATVSLDDEIKKSKPIKKFHPKFNNNQKHGKGHHKQPHRR